MASAAFPCCIFKPSLPIPSPHTPTPPLKPHSHSPFISFEASLLHTSAISPVGSVAFPSHLRQHGNHVLHTRSVWGSGCLISPDCGRLIAARCAQVAADVRDAASRLSGRADLKVFDSTDELGTSLAHYVASLSEVAVKERGSFAVALSGGSLIGALKKLCSPPHLHAIPWSQWHIFWADERVVAKDHADSNFKLAKDGLLSKIPIPPSQVYSINDTVSAEAAAYEYEFNLRQLVKSKTLDASKNWDFPRFDLILLGMGPDGHVASLFPNHPLTQEKEKWIAFITDSPKPPPERITFTFPVINYAANVAVVTTGAGKAEVLSKIFGEELLPGILPAQMVFPLDGKLVWFLDTDAASKLSTSEQVTVD